jgi:phosphate transport system substrate-binding protein
MRSRVAVIVVAVLLSPACKRPAGRSLILSGSTSLQPLAEKWADGYSARHPELVIAVQGGGSTAGVQAAISGAAHIGMVSRSLTPSERAQVRDVTVARDGIVFVVHPSNPTNDVTLDQARAIYAGRIRNWKELGALRLPVTLITREEGSGTRAAFETLVMRGDQIVSSALVQDSTGAVRQMVGGDSAAIGYISVGLVDRSVKALRLNGVAPTESNVDRAVYPLTRPFSFALRVAPTGEVASFISWVSGPEGARLTRREGFLPPLPDGADAAR